VNACTHGPTRHLASGDRCSFCRTVLVAADLIVTVDADPLASGHRGEVPGREHEPQARTTRTIAPEASAARKAAAGPPPWLCASGATIAGAGRLVARAPRTAPIAATAPPPPPGPSPGRLIPSANAQQGASLLGLLDATPVARITDPATSHQAAGFQAGRLRESHRLVLSTLSLAPLTDFELGARTGKAQTSIGCRRGELTRAGMVADSGDTRPAPSGAPAAVWAITDHGRQALAHATATSAA